MLEAQHAAAGGAPDAGENDTMISCDLGVLLCRMCGDKRAVDPWETRKMQSDKGMPDAKSWTQTESSLAQHMHRADWQAEVWHLAATKPQATPPGYADRGHEEVEVGPEGATRKVVRCVYKTLPHAPDALLRAGGCGCNSTGRVLDANKHFFLANKCPCQAAGVQCTNPCRCQDDECKNCGDGEDGDDGGEGGGGGGNGGGSSVSDEIAQEQALTGDATSLAVDSDSDGDDGDAEPLPEDHVVERSLARSCAKSRVRVESNRNGVRCRIWWEGHDEGDDSWEVLDKDNSHNYGRTIHFNRLLDEFCSRTDTDLRDVKASPHPFPNPPPPSVRQLARMCDRLGVCTTAWLWSVVCVVRGPECVRARGGRGRGRGGGTSAHPQRCAIAPQDDRHRPAEDEESSGEEDSDSESQEAESSMDTEESDGSD